MVRQSLLKGNVEKRLILPSCEWGQRTNRTTGEFPWEGRLEDEPKSEHKRGTVIAHRYDVDVQGKRRFLFLCPPA